MHVVYEYKDQAERERILAENVGKFLVEERNIIDGNFLVFTGELPTPTVVYVTIPKEEYDALSSETAALNLAVIDLWETLANGGAA